MSAGADLTMKVHGETIHEWAKQCEKKSSFQDEDLGYDREYKDIINILGNPEAIFKRPKPMMVKQTSKKDAEGFTLVTKKKPKLKK
jgi:hypothetical protein